MTESMFESCICVDLDYETELLDRSRRKARKKHKCCECGWTIRPGQDYEVDTVKDGCRVHRYKTCIPCLNVRNSNLFACGWYYCGVWESIHKAFCFNEDDICICPGREKDDE